MFYVLATMNGGPEKFIEHCYEEQVIVDHKTAITENPNTCSQLQAAFAYTLLGEFLTRKQAEKCRKEYIEKRDILHDSEPYTVEFVPEQIMKLEKEKNWFGESTIIT